MKIISLFFLIFLIMSAACRSQTSMTANPQGADEQVSVQNLKNQNSAKVPRPTSGAVLPESAKLQTFENECYSFDARGLKQDEELQRRFRYGCESSFNLDDAHGYLPTFVVRQYTYEQPEQASLDRGIQQRFYLTEKFNLADQVQREVKEKEKAGYTVKTSSISLGGESAERLDFAFTCPDSTANLRQSSDRSSSRGSINDEVTLCEPGSIEKSYSIIVAPDDKPSNAEKNKKTPGFYLGGRLNKPEQAAILQQILKSWRWK